METRNSHFKTSVIEDGRSIEDHYLFSSVLEFRIKAEWAAFNQPALEKSEVAPYVFFSGNKFSIEIMDKNRYKSNSHECSGFKITVFVFFAHI